MLRIDSVSFAYNGTPVLEGVGLDISRHETVAILGPNGSGKTTLLRCIHRILKPKTGVVFLEEEDLSRISQREIAKRLSYVAQRNTPVRLTAFDAVLLGRKPYIGWNVSDNDIRITQAVMKRIGMEELSLRYIDEMSGGEFQKVCIARALVQEPSAMLLDEPTASLDLKNQIAILELLRDIVRDHEMCALISMHDLNSALHYADRFVFLKRGAVQAVTDREGVTSNLVSHVYEVDVDVRRYDDVPFVVPRA